MGVPFSDPQADGPTIQVAHQVGILQGVTLTEIFTVISDARKAGLTVPIVLMGYLNNFLTLGLENVCQIVKKVGGDGFIIVDLPPEEATTFASYCKEYALCFIPLISPTTSLVRMKRIGELAKGFVYCVR